MNRYGYDAFVSLVLSLATLSPLLTSPSNDSFPFSTYPMFSHRKSVPKLTLVQAFGVDADAKRSVLGPKITAGNEEVISALVTLKKGVAGSRDRKEAFCQTIAQRVVASGSKYAGVSKIELARSTFDTLRYFESSRVPTKTKRLHSCTVER